jgi:hypothetical protein
VRRHLRNARVDLVTVAFTNTNVIREQHRLLSKYTVGDHCWIVVDNSPNRAAARRVRHTCRELAIAYWRIPVNPHTGVDPSRSHALALDLAWRFLLEPRDSEVVGFLDHDVFPIESFDPAAYVSEQPVWGRLIDVDGHWYVWPGLLFARTDHARRYGVDFSLSPGHDTGSANRHALLRELDREALRWPSEHRLQVRGDGSDYQRDFVDVIDG